MLETIFVQTLNMSITAGIMVLFVMLLRVFLKPMPKIYSYVLWAVVLFRLVSPFSFTTDYSLLGLVNHAAAGQGRIEYISADAFNSSNEFELLEKKFELMEKKAEINIEENAVSEIERGVQKATKIVFLGLSKSLLIKTGSMVWLFGMVLLAGGSIREFILLQKSLKGVVLEKENIYYSKTVKTPFTIGMIHPVIILPDNLKKEEKEYIILHEQIHIQRKDQIIRCVSFLLLCVHWFNPLVWTAFILSGRDMEMSCDEAVVRRLGNGVKKEYSMSLLSLASGQMVVGGTPLLFGEGDTKERIKNVLNFKEPKKMAVTAAVCVCAVAGIFLLANPAVGESQNNSTENSNNRIENFNKQNEEMQNQNSQNADSQDENVPPDSDLADSQLADGEENPEVENNTMVEQPENLYTINIRSISRSARCIDRYMIPDDEQIKRLGLEDAYNEETGMIDEPLAFAEDCVFKTNYSINTMEYAEITFDTFADIIEGCDPNQNKTCYAFIENGLVTEIILKHGYINYGIGFSQKTKDSSYYDMVEIVKEMDGEDTNMLETYYTLVYSSLLDSSKKWDVVDSTTHNERTESILENMEVNLNESEEIEAIEVYTGNIGDGDSGYVIVRNADGEILHTEFAHRARAGWNNVYLGSVGGTDYLMTVHIEDRGDFGGYNYEVFRLDKNGEILQMAGSHFEWGDSIVYDDDLFKEWAAGLEFYLENSRLILSSQEGEVHTEAKPEEVYNYETLRRQ